MSVGVVLIRRELRLSDHPALVAACAAHKFVLVAYIHAPEEEGEWVPGAASNWWLHHSLDALSRSLASLGGQLHVAVGNTFQNLRRLCDLTGARNIYWTRRYEPNLIRADTQLKAALARIGLTAEIFPGNLWHEPWRIATGAGEPYKVFTPYWRKVRLLLEPEAPLPAPRAQNWVRLQPGLPLESLGLLPRPDWANGFGEHWRPGEQGAAEALEIFADDAILHYESGRDLPARIGTSRLSPHLHFGEITPGQIHHALHARFRADKPRLSAIEPFLRELGWREFAHHLLYHFPKTPTENFNSRFDAFPWSASDPTLLRPWQRGRTGVPLVDAGMRQLWRTGWMHNRVRMIVASFLTKNLRQHWVQGARWFWDTLVDADLANNTLGWQWVAGCGADAAPYFRIFNPFTQAAKFDPQAVYLKRWLPELASLPPKLLHDPTLDPAALARCGYPAPIVDLHASRQEALAGWSTLPKQ